MQSPIVSLLLYSFRGQGGVLLVMESLGLYLSLALFDWSRAFGGVHTLVLVVLTIPWVLALGVFHHYAWATLRHVAAGHTQTLRTIAVEEVSPLSNYLAFQVVLLLFGVAGALSACYAAEPLLGIYGFVVVGAMLPGMLGVMILEERFLAGLNPVEVWRFIDNCGGAYIFFAGSLYAGVVALYGVFFAPSVPNLLLVFGAGFVFVLGHVLAGRTLYAVRDRLNLATRTDVDPEEAATDAAIEKLMLDLHRLCGVDRVERANSQLEGFLQERNYALDERIHQRLLEFQYKRLLLEHNWHYLGRLVTARKFQRGWLLLRSSLDIDPLFRPGTGAAVLALIGVAAPTDANYVQTLLADFERAYPGDEALPEVLRERARWAPLWDDGSEAR